MREFHDTREYFYQLFLPLATKTLTIGVIPLRLRVMKVPAYRLWAASGLLIGAAFVSGKAKAADIVAVMGSDSPPYQEAFKGLQEAMGRSVDSLNLGAGAPAIPAGTKVIVAIGGKAATASYPDSVPLIYCMSPSVHLARGLSFRISVSPSPAKTLSTLKEIQPGLKRLAAFWASDSLEDDIQEMRKSGGAAGVEILSKRVTGPDQLPDQLRSIQGGADAVWIAADPPILTPESFGSFKAFAVSNRVPLYVPGGGFVAKGGMASIASDFKEMGRAAAAAAQAVLSGRPAGKFYPEKIELILNSAEAERVGVRLSSEVRRKADKVIE